MCLAILFVTSTQFSQEVQTARHMEWCTSHVWVGIMRSPYEGGRMQIRAFMIHGATYCRKFCAFRTKLASSSHMGQSRDCARSTAIWFVCCEGRWIWSGDHLEQGFPSQVCPRPCFSARINIWVFAQSANTTSASDKTVMSPSVKNCLFVSPIDHPVLTSAPIPQGESAKIPPYCHYHTATQCLREKMKSSLSLERKRLPVPQKLKQSVN